MRSLANVVPDLRAAEDADDVEEADHEHGEEGDKDVDESDDHHLITICIHSHCPGDIE